MSNIYKREPFRHHSFISKAATGIVAGPRPDRLRARHHRDGAPAGEWPCRMTKRRPRLLQRIRRPGRLAAGARGGAAGSRFSCRSRRSASATDVRYVLAWKPPSGLLRRLSESRARGQSRRRRRLARRPRRLAGCADLAPVRSRHAFVDDELCAVLGHPLCARHPRIRARAAPGRVALHPSARAVGDPRRRARAWRAWRRRRRGAGRHRLRRARLVADARSRSQG